MDIVLMIVYATLILGFLVFIHEGGHYLAARAFGVRVTEFMLGLPRSQHWLHEMGHEVRRHAVSAGRLREGVRDGARAR